MFELDFELNSAGDFLRVAEAAGGRVIFNVGHHLLNEDSSFAGALEWIAEFTFGFFFCHL